MSLVIVSTSACKLEVLGSIPSRGNYYGIKFYNFNPHPPPPYKCQERNHFDSNYMLNFR